MKQLRKIYENPLVAKFDMECKYDLVLKEKLCSPDLLKPLKGKSGFHIRSLDAEMEKNITQALKKGFALYKKNNWI